MKVTPTIYEMSKLINLYLYYISLHGSKVFVDVWKAVDRKIPFVSVRLAEIVFVLIFAY